MTIGVGGQGKRKALPLRDSNIYYLFSEKGQEAMVRSYMYSPFSEIPPPKGAPKFTELAQKNFRWTPEFIDYVVKNRDSIKEKFSEIMFN